MEERLTRREVREGAFIILYQTLFGATAEEICALNEEAFGLAHNDETEEIVHGVMTHSEELEQIIAKYSTTRSVSRIAKVNMVIMKIAVFEMKYCERIPAAAAINEAVELSKKYAYKADSSFINGVLNAYLGELDAAEK